MDYGGPRSSSSSCRLLFKRAFGAVQIRPCTIIVRESVTGRDYREQEREMIVRPVVVIEESLNKL